MENIRYIHSRESIGLADVSNLYGRVLASGADALDLLHRMSTNDLRPLYNEAGKGIQTVLTTEKGRIVDLLTVISNGTGALLICGKGNENAVIGWLDKFVIMEDARFSVASDSLSQFALFGPRALQYLSGMTGLDLIGMENFSAAEITLHDTQVRLIKSLRIVETGFTIICEKALATDLFTKLSADIEALGGATIDEATYETLRIEAGIPLFPSELNDKHNPLETSLVQAISFTKGCYIGQEVIARLDTYDKVQRHLMGVLTDSPDALTAPTAIATSDGTQIGEITSTAFSPALGKTIGLGFIKTAFANPGNTVTLDSRSGTLVSLPFDVEV